MSLKFRTPPKIPIPLTSRWECVFQLSDDIEIWFLNLRQVPTGYYPVFCKLKDDRPMPLYSVPLIRDELKNNSRVIKGWGNHFFWSKKECTLVVQLLHTIEYSTRLEAEQIFLSGETFVVQKILKDENLTILPNKDFKEVFPEMHPDRLRLE